MIAFTGISKQAFSGQTVTGATTTYLVGVGLAVAGLIILTVGFLGIVLSFVLEILDREHKDPSVASTSPRAT
jgi:hypothetical protein